jgi:hypothetical protein
MTLRKKLIALAVPAVLAVIAVPVAVAAHAQSVTPARAAAAKAQSVTPSLAAVTHSKSVARTAVVGGKFATKARIALAASTEADSSTETADAVEADDPNGHADETAGSTVESTTDHQFDGTE